MKWWAACALGLLLHAGPGLANPLARADAAFAQQRPHAAWVEILNATQADPGNAIAWMYQARIALRLERPAAALVALDRARAAGYPEARMVHFRAHALLLQGQARAALDLLDRVAAAAPFQAYIARMRGRALAGLGEHLRAAEAFGVALRRTPRDPELWIDLARFRRSTGELAGAIDASVRAYALAPGRVSVLRLRGEMVREQFGLAASLPWFDRALAIDPQDMGTLLERAATLGELGATRAMLADTRAVLSLDPRNPRAFWLQAVLAARARNLSLAMAMLDRTEGALDGLPAVRQFRAAIACQRGDWQAAIRLLRPLLASQPGNVRTRQLLALALWQAGEPEGVIELLSPLDGSADGDSYAQILLARAAEAIGRRDAAAVHLERAFREYTRPDLAPESQAPGEAAYRISAIRGLLRQGRSGDALDQARRLVRDNPGAPEGRLALGDVLVHRDRPAEAAFVYRDAANMRFDAAAAIRLVDAMARAGDTQSARRVLDAFRRQHPRNRTAQLVEADLRLADGDARGAMRLLTRLDQRMGRRDAVLAAALGRAALEAGEGDRAVEAACRAYRLAPASPLASQACGQALQRTGRDGADAAALLRQAAAQRHLEAAAPRG